MLYLLLGIIRMKHILTIIFGLFIGNSVFATGQVPDYMIYKGDTVVIFSTNWGKRTNRFRWLWLDCLLAWLQSNLGTQK